MPDTHAPLSRNALTMCSIDYYWRSALRGAQASQPEARCVRDLPCDGCIERSAQAHLRRENLNLIVVAVRSVCVGSSPVARCITDG